MTPRLVSYTPFSVTGVEIAGFWRLHVGVFSAEGSTTDCAIGLALFRYFGGSSRETSPACLARVPVPFLKGMSVTDQYGAVSRVTSVMVSTGDRAKDKTRSREALSMFRNMQGVSEKQTDDLADACDPLIDAYWDLRQWADGQFQSTLELQVPSARTRIMAHGTKQAAPKTEQPAEENPDRPVMPTPAVDQ